MRTRRQYLLNNAVAAPNLDAWSFCLEDFHPADVLKAAAQAVPVLATWQASVDSVLAGSSVKVTATVGAGRLQVEGNTGP